MNKKDVYEEALELIANNPSLIDEIQVNVNVPFPTAGGSMMWDTVAESNGWKLQKNKITGLGRILDSSNNRHSWGDMSKLRRRLREIVDCYGASNSTSTSTSLANNNKGNSDVTGKLLDLKKLLDAGVISQAEYDRLKCELMNQFKDQIFS
ncbi:hypothetical protein UYO_1465 [Lachnospiraceae bacterium JC7]|nr:hypothetical protein UYO_1465 [Lachnospiraceae bacterium JC7]